MQMHLCTCRVNLAGQGFTYVDFLESDPVSWPEVQILIALHGDESVHDIKPVKITEANHRMEKNRLLVKYGHVVEKVFPGRNPRMEMVMPGEPENQPRVDQDGLPAENGNGHPTPTPDPIPDDEDDDDAAVKGQGLEPPVAPAVFKPGKHPRPPVGV